VQEQSWKTLREWEYDTPCWADGDAVHEKRVMWTREERAMSMRVLLLIIVIVLLIAALPTWPYSAGWGYYPGGLLGLVVIVLLVLLLLGRI
jgi:hypothetical protein